VLVTWVIKALSGGSFEFHWVRLPKSSQNGSL